MQEDEEEADYDLDAEDKKTADQSMISNLS